MATIISQPDSISFSDNIRKIEIASSSDIRFALKKGDIDILDESYSPSNGRIIIDISAVVKNYLSLEIPNENIYRQNNIVALFIAHIDSLPPLSFNVIRGGVDNFADTTTNFLAANWLTWQPQTKKVTYSQPEWLTYYAVTAAVIKVKFYLKNNTSTVVSIHNQDAATCYSYNMQFSYVMTLQDGDKYGYYDVWVENINGTRLSYIQRYIYQEAEDLDDIFCFENSLGGIDTARLSGDSNYNPELEYISGTYDDVAVQLDNFYKKRYQKNTGWLSAVESDWIIDFFHSLNKYKLCSGTIRKIVLHESTINNRKQEDLKSFDFSYGMSEDRGLLNLTRTMEPLPANLEISTPESLFFLAPRLVDFPAATLQDDLLFPVQSPFVQLWQKLSWGALWNFLYDKILASAIGLMAHVHDNFSVISQFQDKDGKLYYNDIPVGAGDGDSIGLKLGTTSKTAGRGDHTQTAYEHTLESNIHIQDVDFDNITYARNNQQWVPLPTPGGRSVRLSTSKQVFEYNEQGQMIDPTTYSWIYSTLFNIQGDSIYYEYLQNGVILQNTTSSVIAYAPPSTYSTPDVIRVNIRLGSSTSSIVATDTITMYGIKPGADGSDAYTIVLSNPTHTFPADANGSVTDYSGSGTDIRVWHGIAPLNYASSGPMTFSVNASGINVTPGSASTVNSVIRRYGNSYNMISTTARIDFNISVRDKDSNLTTFTQVMSYTISAAGKDGEDGRDGKDGELGPMGPSAIYRGDYSPSTTYYGNSERIDIVKYSPNGLFYSALNTAGAFSGKAPIDAQYWKRADGQFEFVATKLLLAESTYIRNLIAEQLKTAQSGKRVEINAGDKQQIAIYDSSENLKVLIKPEPVAPISHIESGTAISNHNTSAMVTPQYSAWYTPDFNSTSYVQYSDSFIVTLGGTLEIQIANMGLSASAADGIYARAQSAIVVSLQKIYAQEWTHVDTIAYCSNEDNSKSIDRTIKGLTSGTYRLVANHYHDAWNDLFPGQSSVSDECYASSAWRYLSGSTFLITARRVIAQTEIGTDGIASVWAANRYFHFSSNGLFIKIGTKTFEVTENAIKINGIIQ